MRRILVLTALGAALVAACSSASTSAVDELAASPRSSSVPGAKTQVLTGHLTPEIRQAPVVGRMPPTTSMSLTLSLPVPDLKGLLAAVSQVSDPKSSAYRKYLSTTEFGDKFGTKPADYEKKCWPGLEPRTSPSPRTRIASSPP